MLWIFFLLKSSSFDCKRTLSFRFFSFLSTPWNDVYMFTVMFDWNKFKSATKQKQTHFKHFCKLPHTSIRSHKSIAKFGFLLLATIMHGGRGGGDFWVTSIQFHFLLNHQHCLKIIYNFFRFFNKVKSFQKILLFLI